MGRGRNGNGRDGKSGGGKDSGVVYRGTDGDDTFIGGDDDEKMIGSAGNDTFVGGAGIDVADYSRLDTAITVKTAGIVEKGALGTDTLGSFDVATGELEVIEEVVGAKGERNLVDGTSVVGAVNLDVDLESGAYTSTVVVPIGDFQLGDSFSTILTNFVDVNGTNNDDTIRGSDADNIFGGSAGNDFFDGRDGVDTVDYTGLGSGVTLLANGEIDKGGLGTDTIQGMERIVGDAGQENTIDGTVDGPQTSSFVIDLAASQLTVQGTSIGDLNFEVVNFQNVVGTSNADDITGDASANTIAGAGGSDMMAGGGGDDMFVFGPPAGDVDTVSDFSVGDTLMLESGFGGFDGDTLGYDDVFGADGTGNTLEAGGDTITSAQTADGLAVSFNGDQFALLQEDMMIA